MRAGFFSLIDIQSATQKIVVLSPAHDEGITLETDPDSMIYRHLPKSTVHAELTNVEYLGNLGHSRVSNGGHGFTGGG